MGFDTFFKLCHRWKGGRWGLVGVGVMGGARSAAKRSWVMVARQDRGIGWNSHKYRWIECKYKKDPGYKPKVEHREGQTLDGRHKGWEIWTQKGAG